MVAKQLKECPVFSDKDDRARLTATALEAYRNLSKNWKLSAEDAAALIAVPISIWGLIERSEWSGILSQDQLTRVSALVGIFMNLQGLFSEEYAHRWVGLPNKGPIFGGRSPVEAMVEDGVPCMIETRRYVEALQLGL
jgi:hypothetical protein